MRIDFLFLIVSAADFSVRSFLASNSKLHSIYFGCHLGSSTYSSSIYLRRNGGKVEMGEKSLIHPQITKNKNISRAPYVNAV